MPHREALIVALVVLMAGAAEAQDFGPSGSAGSAAPGASFDGAYVGFSGAFSQVDRGFSSNFGLLPAESDKSDHVSAGFHAGYGATFGSLYLGAEGDVQFFDDDGFEDSGALNLLRLSGPIAGAIVGAPVRPGRLQESIRIEESYRQRVRQTVSAKVRAGYQLGRFMPFVTGGVTAGHVQTDYAARYLSDTTRNGALVGQIRYTPEISDDQVQFGYTLGAGLDVAILENVSLRGEYVFTDLGTQRYIFESASFQDLEAEFDTKIHNARIGFSYHF